MGPPLAFARPAAAFALSGVNKILGRPGLTFWRASHGIGKSMPSKQGLKGFRARVAEYFYEDVPLSHAKGACAAHKNLEF